MNLFQQWKSDSDYHDQNENTIISDNNIENSNENSEEDESPDDDRSLENETLGNHMALQCDI